MSPKAPINIKTDEELAKLRKAGKILAEIFEDVTRSLKTGMTTQRVNDLAEKLMKAKKVTPAFKGYRGFPASVCISINQEIVHGIPGARVIEQGDVVSIDMGVVCDGYYADMAMTVAFGNVDAKLKGLIDTTRQALARGIAKAEPGNHLSDISFAIQYFVESRGLSVVRDFVGHGIGKALHEEPEIPNFGTAHCGPLLKAGMVFCIEPMVNLGSWQAKIRDDGWTVETLDGSASAHFEHMVAVTKEGPEILTRL